MKVLVAGIPRSGSTLVYNIVRLVMGEKFETIHSSWIDDFRAQTESSAVVVKTHDPNDSVRCAFDVIFCSHRDLRDIAASLSSMGWANSDDDRVANARKARECHDYWAPAAALDIRYETLIVSPQDVVNDVAKALNIELKPGRSAEIISQIPRDNDGKNQFDSTTLLHRGHVTDGRFGRWKEHLNPETAAAIWHQNEEWMLKMGYSPNG